MSVVLKRFPSFFAAALLTWASLPSLGAAATITVSLTNLDGIQLASDPDPVIKVKQVRVRVFDVRRNSEEEITNPDTLISTAKPARIIIYDRGKAPTPFPKSTPEEIHLAPTDTPQAVRLEFSSTSGGLQAANINRVLNSPHTLTVPMPQADEPVCPSVPCFYLPYPCCECPPGLLHRFFRRR